MKFNLKTQLVNYDDKPINKSAEDKSPITLGEILTMACVNANPQTHNTGEGKYEIYQLLQKVSKDGKVDLDAEEIVLLKSLVGFSYGVVVVGSVYDLLEQKTEEG